jgi:hypothetical protein
MLLSHGHGHLLLLLDPRVRYARLLCAESTLREREVVFVYLFVGDGWCHLLRAA